MKKFSLKAGSPADAESCIVLILRTANANLKPGDIVKVVNNFTVDKVADNNEQAWGIVSGKWDGNPDSVPVIISGLIYMPPSMLSGVGQAPRNVCIFNFGTENGKIEKPDGTIENSVALAWINL